MNKKIGALLSVLLLIAIAIFGVMFWRETAKVKVADRFFQQGISGCGQQAGVQDLPAHDPVYECLLH